MGGLNGSGSRPLALQAGACVFKALAATAASLQQWRKNRLKPQGWVRWEHAVKEKAEGFPPRPLPVAARAAE
jgi:hypothetical protein